MTRHLTSPGVGYDNFSRGEDLTTSPGGGLEGLNWEGLATYSCGKSMATFSVDDQALEYKFPYVL